MKEIFYALASCVLFGAIAYGTWLAGEQFGQLCRDAGYGRAVRERDGGCHCGNDCKCCDACP